MLSNSEIQLILLRKPAAISTPGLILCSLALSSLTVSQIAVTRGWPGRQKFEILEGHQSRDSEIPSNTEF